MNTPTRSPELLAPAGSIDAVRAAVANGADAVYLGAERFNARDEGAQLTLDELAEACRIVHASGARLYLTLNTLVKPHELMDALTLLGACIDRGIDAAIVQDLGLVRLIQHVFPRLEIHGSTQLTVHDESGARVMHALGIDRVVLARENTLEDIAAIRSAVPELGLESFVHGALCISYSGQCFMSGMISERSANRGSCAQSCRKDYVLTDADSGTELDRGYLISARDLAAVEHIDAIADAGIVCVKVEGRKKKPEYVATVTHSYRALIDAHARGESTVATADVMEPLVQIFSRGFTGGMYGGRAGRAYVTRTHPDNRGLEIGTVVGRDGTDLLVDVAPPICVGDGLAFEAPGGRRADIGFAVTVVRTIREHEGRFRQAIFTHAQVPDGWRVVRSAEAALTERARASFASVARQRRDRGVRLDIRAFGAAGSPLKLVATAGGHTTTLQGDVPLVPAVTHALDARQLREHLGKLGETTFHLGTVDASGLGQGLFLPMSEINHLRQAITETLSQQIEWARLGEETDRHALIQSAVRAVDRSARPGRTATPFVLSVEVYSVADAHLAADSGATEIVLDPFLRHPSPPRAHLTALRDELAPRGIAVRLRTPTIVRPEERKSIDRWLALELPMVTGHLGLAAELAAAGRDVVGDYALNCFNQHTAAEFFRLGIGRIAASVELTVDEIAAVVEPWDGAGFDVLIYGRPEGMTIEHCTLSAAFDREPTTCRDLCIQKHPNVHLTDPAGYVFPVATDTACRNRLLHSRPIEASEFLPRLWAAGLRGYRVVFNTPGDEISRIVAGYRAALDALAAGVTPDLRAMRQLVDGEFTRGHFARAV